MSNSVQPATLTAEGCRARQQRLRDVMQRLQINRCLLFQPEHVQYFSGFRPRRLLSAAICLDADGRCLLVAPNAEPEFAAVDEILTFEAQWHSTLRQDQRLAIIQLLSDAGTGSFATGRIGLEFSGTCRHAESLLSGAETLDIEPEIWSLRRRKDPDELRMIRNAIACTEAMYAKAREIIEPGITEIEVYNQLHQAAVETAGEPVTGLGNDYQCNSPGGPPRNRPAQDGELFVLDLGLAYRGYYADNCRSMRVSSDVSDQQQTAWQMIVDVLQMVEETVRPGQSARELFQQAQTMLDEYRPDTFPHHLGHGFGLFPHEGPHLNPRWDDTFEEGDVFTAEPGLYGPELRAGIRLEQNYVVTETGVERLTSYPLEL